jgi:hypothetical protein
MLRFVILTICQRSGSCCGYFFLIKSCVIPILTAIIKLKIMSEIALQHEPLLLQMVKNNQPLWTDLSKWPPNCKILKI